MIRVPLFHWLHFFLVLSVLTGPGIDTIAAQEFRPTLEPLVRDSCIDCHDGSDENGLDFSELGNDLSDDATFRKWEQIYDRLADGTMPPESEARPDSRQRIQSLESLKHSLVQVNKTSQAERGRTVLRRLTRTEYQHTLNDLFAINVDIADGIPAEGASTRFDTVANAQGFSPLHIRSYLKSAEIALEEAIQLKERPKSETKRLDYAASKLVRQHIDEKKDSVIIGELDDAVLMFNTASYLFKMENSHITHAGWYKIRIKAGSYQSVDPVVLTINAGNYNRGFAEIIGQFDLPQEVRQYELKVYLTRGQYLFPGVEQLRKQPDGKTIWNIPPDQYTGAGVVLHWIEIEGPVIDDWPPFSTTHLLQDVELKNLDHPKWDSQRGQKVQFEIIPGDHPKKQLESIVASLAPRAFRRPTPEQELTPFVKLGIDSIDKGGSFDDAVRVTCRAVLASPQFLFMASPAGKLDDFALASRLSYFLWKSMPDEALFQLASKKRLSNPQVLAAQVDRMLADPKSDRFVVDFTNQWLRLSEIDATTPDKRLYPEFDQLLKKSMLKETRAFIAYLFEQDLGVAHLIDSDFSFLNRRLAEHYGVPDVEGQHLRKVQIPDESPRGGILTHASVLKVTANGTRTSPVLRGIWMLTHLMGQPPNPPPPTGAIDPDTRGTSTVRELLAKHRDNVSCATCHKQIDPPGFALECFDVIGGYRERFRSREKGDRPEHLLCGRKIWEYKIGLPVDASGVTPGGEPFEGIRDYKKLLLKEKEQIARNIISQLITYSTGAEIQFADRDRVEKILERCRESDFGFKTMIHEIVKSKLFLYK